MRPAKIFAIAKAKATNTNTNACSYGLDEVNDYISDYVTTPREKFFYLLWLTFRSKFGTWY
jgi:hypothetical protein